MTNLKHNIGLALVLFACTVPSVKADSVKKPSKSDTYTLSNKSTTAKISIHKSTGKVTVDLLPPVGDKPNSLTLTVRDKNQNPFTVELQAIPSSDPGTATYQGHFPPYSSNAGLPQGSYFGMELSIPFSKGHTEVIRSN